MNENKRKYMLTRLFLSNKPSNIIIYIKDEERTYANVICKKVDCTYAHVIKILNIFGELNLIKFEKEGRTKYIKLTEDGIEIAHDIEGLMRKFNRISKDKKPKKKIENNEKNDTPDKL